MYQKLFYTDFTTELCSDRSMVELMLNVELALAKSQAKNGIIPSNLGESLEQLFQKVEIDIELLKSKIALSGNAAAPLVKQLTAAVKKHDPEAAKYIHLGATSQDIVDTATILKIKKYTAWLHEKAAALEAHLQYLTKQHRQTSMIGRTLMQQARPITFGLKTEGWLRGIQAAVKNLQLVENQLFVIQLSGAVGNRNQYLTESVCQAFAENLGLKNASNWHTQRVNIAAFASALGVLTGSLAKIANDIVLLSQTEVGEVNEPAAEGRGTSSTMPHKRNPILSIAILANAHRVPFLVATILAAMPQEHERAAGRWHAEWETLDDLMGLTAGALEKAVELIEGLEVNKDRMLKNIHLTNGLVFAEQVALELAKKMGKEEAHELVKTFCRKAQKENRHLREILLDAKIDISDMGFLN